jgi:hypothetical protein
MWTTWNFVIEKLWKENNHAAYLRLSYEDFVSKPKKAIGKILQSIGAQDPLDFFEEPSSVKLGEHHTVSGNPVRIKTGTSRIRSDQEWVRKLSVRDKYLPTMLTAPLLWRYGYPTIKKSESRNQIIIQ